MSVLPSDGGPPSPGWGLPRGLDVLDATVQAGRLNPPAAGRAEVLRPRLHDALTAAVAATPLTVITGPTGSGKTVLAAAWARAQAAQAVAWLSLGPTAADAPRAFWAGVVHALRRAGVPLETPTHRARLPAGFTIRLAAQLDALPRPVVLVIDHAETLTRPDILESLDLLVGAVPSRLRLVLLGRADPLLPPAGRRPEGRLSEIRADDLAFRPEEARAALARLGTPVPEADAAALADATGGTAVALPLVAALLRRGVRPPEVAAAPTDDDGGPVPYLLDRVLALLPQSMRGVLLRAAVAAELWPGLVTAVTDRGDALRVLRWLAAGHVCVERAPGGPGGLRIPSLVRELLVAELASTDPDAHVAARRAAAEWYAAAERLPEAATHAIAAGDWAAVASLLVDDLAVAALLARSGPPEADLLDAARPQLGGADAALLRAAATLTRTGAAQPADLAFALAVAARENGRPARQASAALLLAAADIAADADPARALAAVVAAQAQAAVLVGARPERRAECAAVLATMRASALLATDAVEPALIDCIRAAEDACAAAGTDRLRAGRLADLALVQALAGRLGQAEALVAEYEGLCEGHDVPRAKRSPAAATAAAWVCSERGQTAEARRWAARAAEGEGHRRAVFTAPLLAVLDSRRHRLRGQLDAAEHALAAAPDGDRLPRWVREQVVTERVRLALARGDADALRPLDALGGSSPRISVVRATAAAHGVASGPAAVPEAVGTGVLPVVAIEEQLVRADLLAAEGHTEAAVAVLAEALRSAGHDELRRPFLDAPPSARRLLRTHRDLAAARRWLGSTHPSPAPAGPPQPGVLSDREREALALLAAGLSTAGIAAAMGTSTNTARTHLRSIQRKLSATDRSDAVGRAAAPPEAAS